jgi:peptidoglycan L-alanyl-D-glutamate endopeptidase CwlK
VSRDLCDLEIGTRRKVMDWIAGCAGRGVEILVYCTLRTPAEQALLYEIGRTRPGKIVTNAPAWQSWHNYGRAVDAVPILHGKPDWTYDQNERHWRVFAEEAERVGLEWAGRWERFREYVHVQDTGGMTLAEAYKERR